VAKFGLPSLALYGKVSAMESNWAAEHLQTIRTLMERSAIYRRALAPIMIYVGTIGTAAALVGWILKIASPHAFILYWAAVATLALAGSFLLVRRQALKDSEPFWSPPTRRITQALLPPLTAGLILSGVILLHTDSARQNIGPGFNLLWLPLGWAILYGCAFHAAGFFMPRGMKIFGWAFILGGCALFAAGIPESIDRVTCSHGIMGFFFGVLHLAYGGYLFFTEKRRNET
jgi:hypothetical protein